MTNRLALFLVAILLAAAIADLFANRGEVLLFLARKMVDLTEYLLFWR